MKIVHINSHDVGGGAEKVAERLANAQRAAGHEVFNLVGTRRDLRSNAIVIDSGPAVDLQASLRAQGLLFYEYAGSFDLVNHPLVKSADILHLHNLHGDYFNPFALAHLSKARPVVWTFHDMWAMTGHCAHSLACDRWVTGCYDCPDLTLEPAVPKDRTELMWHDKRRIYQECAPMRLVGPSKWMAEKLRRGILGHHPVCQIPLGIDTEMFAPRNKTEARRRLGISEKTFVIGNVAHFGAFTNRWKGGKYSLEVLQKLAGLEKDFLFLSVGGKADEPLPQLRCLDRVTDERELSWIFSAMDVFLTTSIAETFPLATSEALSCGVPVIGFDVGGVPEVIGPDGGFVVPFPDVDAIVSCLRKIKASPDLLAQLSQGARAWILSEYPLARMCREYEALYQDASADALAQSTRVEMEDVVGELGRVSRKVCRTFVELEKRGSVIRELDGGCKLLSDECRMLRDVVDEREKSILALTREAATQVEDLQEKQQELDSLNRQLLERKGIIDGLINSRQNVAAKIERLVGNGFVRAGVLSFLVPPGLVKGLEKEVRCVSEFADGEQAAAISGKAESDPGAAIVEPSTSPDLALLRLKRQLVLKEQEIQKLKRICEERNRKLAGLRVERNRQWVEDLLTGRHVKWFAKQVRRAVERSIYHFLVDRYWMRLGVLFQFAPRPIKPDVFPPSQVNGDLPSMAIVTPSYMQGVFLERTIKSILDQNYPKLCYAVQDGGSKDESSSVIEKYRPSLSWAESAPDRGQADAIAKGFTKVSGDIMAWLNSDDVLLPGCLDFVGKFFAEHPDVDVLYGHRILIDEHDQEVGRWVLPEHDPETLRWVDFVPQETMFWRRELWEKVGGIDTSFRFAMDWDLLLRFQQAGARMVRVPYFLACFRVHEKQKTSAEIGASGMKEMALVREREHGRPVEDKELPRYVKRVMFRAMLCSRLMSLGIRK